MKKRNNGAGGAELKIENGVPIPPKGDKKGYVAAVRKLKVGQSVHIPGKHHVAFNAIRGAGGNQTTHTGRREGNGCRVWRIA